MSNNPIHIQVERVKVIRADSAELPVIVYVREDEAHDDEADPNGELEFVLVDVYVDAEGNHIPGHTTGLPENCYPEEHWFDVTGVEAEDEDGQAVSVQLTEREIATAEEIYFDIADCDPPDDYDYDCEPSYAYMDYMN